MQKKKKAAKQSLATGVHASGFFKLFRYNENKKQKSLYVPFVINGDVIHVYLNWLSFNHSLW